MACKQERLTSIGIAGEVTSPLDEGAALEIARSDREQADSGQDRSVAELRLRSDDTVGDVVVDGLQCFSVYVGTIHRLSAAGSRLWSYAVLLLLDLKLGAILEGPLDNIGIVTGALDPLAGLQGRPPVGEVLD